MEPSGPSLSFSEFFRQKCSYYSTIVFSYLLPLTKARQIKDFISTNKLFGRYNSLNYVLNQSYFFTMLIMITISAVRVPSLANIQLLQVNDPFDRLVSINAAFMFYEITLLRLWLYWLVRKHNVVDKIPFIQLLSKMKKTAQFSFTRTSKYVLVFVDFGFYVGIVIYFTWRLVTSIGTRQVVMNIFYFIGFMQIVQNGVNDVLILYSFTVAGSKVVMKQFKQFESAISHYLYNTFQRPMLHLLCLYVDLTQSIQQLNSITRVLMLTSEVILFPVVSSFIYLGLQPEQGLLMNILKFAITVDGFLYFNRGHFLVALLSQIDSEGKKVYSMIHSAIARNEHDNYCHVVQLKMILEDMSCSRSHMVVREFNGIVNQMDVYESLVSTSSVLFLLYDFTSSFNRSSVTF